MSGAQPVHRGAAISHRLGHLTVELFPNHEGGPWLVLGVAGAAFANTPAVAGMAGELRALANAIDVAGVDPVSVLDMEVLV